MRHRVPLGIAAGAIAALLFSQESAERAAAATAGKESAAGVTAATVGAATVGAVTVGAATVSAATVGAATVGAGAVGAATVGAATVGAATVGAVTVGAATGRAATGSAATVGAGAVGAATTATVSAAAAGAATINAATVGAATLGSASAGAATVGPIQLTIPDGFEFARSGHHDGARVSAWTKANGSTKALLQVTLYDMGSTADTSTPQELSHAVQAYLRQFLGGVERRRTDYELSPVRELRLASGPAASATWKGKLAGVDTVGVMYCAIIRKRYIVIFHTQDVGDAPTAAMRDAMKSIEAAQALPH